VGIDGDNAGRLGRIGNVDPLDSSVRERAPNHCEVNRARKSEVVDIVTSTSDQPGVFAAMDLGANHCGDGHG
jgi:predicted homoserine dehydrogenase-like protein